MTTFYSGGCAANYENTGKCACQYKMGTPAAILLTDKDVEFDALAAFTEAACQTFIKQGRMWPLFEVGETINNTAEDGVYALPNGLGSIPLSSAKWDISTMFQEGVYSHNALESFRGFSGRVFIVDANGVVWGTSSDGVKFKGFSVKNGQVTNVMLPTSNSEVERRGLRLIYDNKDEYRRDRAAIEVTFADTLEGLTNAVISYVSLNEAKTAVTVSVVRECDGSPVLGLAAGDFTLANDEGEAEVISSVTAGSVNGQYELAVTALGADEYLVDLAAPASATTFGYESTGPDTFTVGT